MKNIFKISNLNLLISTIVFLLTVPAVTLAKTKTVTVPSVNNVGISSIGGDVYNQGQMVINTSAEGFTPEIKPQSYSAPFSVSKYFQRVTYSNNQGYGCVFEFHAGQEMGDASTIQYYALQGSSLCDVIIVGQHVTLIVNAE